LLKVLKLQSKKFKCDGNILSNPKLPRKASKLEDLSSGLMLKIKYLTLDTNRKFLGNIKVVSSYLLELWDLLKLAGEEFTKTLKSRKPLKIGISN